MNLPNNPTPDISQSDTYIVLNTVPIVNLLNGNADDIRYFIFGANSTIESNSNIKLQGETDFTGTIGDSLSLIYDGSEWLELSRSLNPIYTGGSLNQYYLDGGYLAQEIENLKNSVSVLQNQMSLMGVIEVDYEIIFSPGMTTYDMQYRIDSLNKNIVNNATVSIIFEAGLYNITTPLIFSNINGDGKLNIYSKDFTSGLSNSKITTLDATGGNNSIFKFTDCNVSIDVREFQCKTNLEDNNDYNGSIEIYKSSNINIDSMFMENFSMNNSCVYFENSSGSVQNTYVNKGKYGIHSNQMSNIFIQNCDDIINKPSYGIASTYGSIISLFDSQQPQGLISDTYSNVASSINA